MSGGIESRLFMLPETKFMIVGTKFSKVVGKAGKGVLNGGEIINYASRRFSP